MINSTREEQRLSRMTRAVALSTLACLAVSWRLWLSTRLYPLTPAWGLLPPFPFPSDVLVLACLVGMLLGVVAVPRSRPLLAGVVVLFAVLFAQDQSRLWPSFYELFFCLLLLLVAPRPASEVTASRTLMGLRFVMAAVYFWGGALKLNPFFAAEFSWFVRPLTDLLPFSVPFMPAIAAGAAVFEMLFAIGLLTRRFRAIAIWEALLMHAAILVCIGPLRGDWNDAAWVWSLTMAARLWILFHAAPPFDVGAMFAGPPRSRTVPALAVVFVGVLPILNTANRWDSAVSFNVYTGNVGSATVLMDPAAVSRLPAEVARHVHQDGEWAVLQINDWAMAEFNAGAYPERRVFRRVCSQLCGWLDDPSARIVIVNKAGWFTPKATRVHQCGEL
jgi:hypothetical protein